MQTVYVLNKKTKEIEEKCVLPFGFPSNDYYNGFFIRKGIKEKDKKNYELYHNRNPLKKRSKK